MFGSERGGAERNGAVRKMSGRGEQEEGGKLRGGAGRGGGRGAESCAVEQGEAAEEGSGGANNACNFWGRVVRESPVLYDFVYYKAIFMEL